MKQAEEAKKPLSRRDFIKTTTVGVGATAFTGLSIKAAMAAGLPEKWDKVADVVVGCRIVFRSKYRPLAGIATGL